MWRRIVGALGVGLVTAAVLVRPQAPAQPDWPKVDEEVMRHYDTANAADIAAVRALNEADLALRAVQTVEDPAVRAGWFRERRGWNCSAPLRDTLARCPYRRR